MSQRMHTHVQGVQVDGLEDDHNTARNNECTAKEKDLQAHICSLEKEVSETKSLLDARNTWCEAIEKQLEWRNKSIQHYKSLHEDGQKNLQGRISTITLLDNELIRLNDVLDDERCKYEAKCKAFNELDETHKECLAASEVEKAEVTQAIANLEAAYEQERMLFQEFRVVSQKGLAEQEASICSLESACKKSWETTAAARAETAGKVQELVAVKRMAEEEEVNQDKLLCKARADINALLEELAEKDHMIDDSTTRIQKLEDEIACKQKIIDDASESQDVIHKRCKAAENAMEHHLSKNRKLVVLVKLHTDNVRTLETEVLQSRRQTQVVERRLQDTFEDMKRLSSFVVRREDEITAMHIRIEQLELQLEGWENLTDETSFEESPEKDSCAKAGDASGDAESAHMTSIADKVAGRGRVDR